MKRILSAILAAVTITVLCQPAFAAKECACGNLPIIVVKGFGEHLFETDPDGEKHEVFPPDTRTILRSVPDIAYGINAKGTARLFSPVTARGAQLLPPTSINTVTAK